MLEKSQILLTFWDKLTKIKQLTFKVKTSKHSGWNGEGRGEVVVTIVDSDTLIFTEKGTWIGQQGEMDFHNVFRWTLDRDHELISLEHLRRGYHHPVFLFHLAPSSKQSLSALDPHLCGEDAYFGQVDFDVDHIHLNWRVIGPKKDEELDSVYSF